MTTVTMEMFTENETKLMEKQFEADKWRPAQNTESEKEDV